MSQAVILVEERSAAIVVTALARRLQLEPPPHVIPHQGKSDLERSISNKVRNWTHPGGSRFVVLRDNDGGDCKALKQQLFELVPEEMLCRVKVRIVLQELEAWYFGDTKALAAAGVLDEDDARNLPKRAKFRNPDAMQNPKSELFRLLKSKRIWETGQIALARRIAPHLSLDQNRSISFGHAISALRWAAGLAPGERR